MRGAPLLLLLGAGVLGLAGGFGGLWSLSGGGPSSDAAILLTRLVPVAPDGSGRVSEIDVAEDEYVRAGARLLRIEPADAGTGASPAISGASDGMDLLRAPGDGWVRGLSVRVGEIVGPGQALLTIADDDGWWIQADFPAADAPLLTPGRGVHVRLAPYPDLALAGVILGAAPLPPAPGDSEDELRVSIRLDERPADPSVRLREGTAATVTLDPLLGGRG